MAQLKGCQKRSRRVGFTVRIALRVVLSFCLWGTVWGGVAGAAGPVPVFVSIAPQKYFVEKIGGKLVEVSVMVEPGANPHNYEPKPRQMVALSKAKTYFGIGISFEDVWLKRIAEANPDLLIVHTEAGLKKIRMIAHRHDEEPPHRDHGEKDGHHDEGERAEEPHEIKDPHVWLSPHLVMLQARNILQALLAVDPSHRSVYEANYKEFILELVELDAEIRGVFAGKGEDVEFMVFHPSWGYFARAYGLGQVPVEVGGKEPKPANLNRLIQHAKKKGIKVVFVQPQFSTKSAEVIAKAIGGQITFADPLAPDWADSLRKVASSFKAALR